MNPTALQILKAALKEIEGTTRLGQVRLSDCRLLLRVIGSNSSAALDEAAKAPGIDRDKFYAWIVRTDHRAGDQIQQDIDQVLDALDAYQRGGK